MKKSGGAAATEKRRVRRSPGALQSSARDSNSDAPPKFLEVPLAVAMPVREVLHLQSSVDPLNKLCSKLLDNPMFVNISCLDRCLNSLYNSILYTSSKQAPQKDVFQLFADKVRDHKGLESRWAVLQETRVEYFKGKDFISFLKNNAEVKEILGSDKNLEIEDIGNALLRKNLIVRCDRVVKTLRPGKKKLSTWPAHLEIFPEQVFSDSNAFFAWAFVKRHPLWQTLLSFFWPVLTLAICLFPVYPHQVKLLILYSCAGILLLILSLLFVRAAMFGALYILVGKRTWFFPNILAEEATLRELFRFWPRKDEEERPKWTTRLFYAIVAMLVILLLRHHAPDEAARARYQKRVSNIIDDVLEWSPKLALSGMMEKQLTVVNATESNCSSAHCTNTGPDVGAGAETPAEQHVEEVGDV